MIKAQHNERYISLCTGVFWRDVHGLGTWLCGGGDPGMAVAAFLSFLGRVQLSDAGVSVSAARGKEDSRLFYNFIKLIFH